MAVFRDNHTWYIDYNGNGVWDSPAGEDRIYITGKPGDIPVPGDWNGDGITEMASVAVTPGTSITMVMVSGTALPGATGFTPLVSPAIYRYTATGMAIDYLKWEYSDLQTTTSISISMRMDCGMGQLLTNDMILAPTVTIRFPENGKVL